MLASLAVVGCGKFIVENRISSTWTTPGGGDRRLWAITRDGMLHSAVLKSDGSTQWVDEGASALAKRGGVTAISWLQQNMRHERAYFVLHRQ